MCEGLTVEDIGAMMVVTTQGMLKYVEENFHYGLSIAWSLKSTTNYVVN